MNNKAQGVSALSSGAMVMMVTGLILVFTLIIINQFGALDVIEAGSDAEGAYNDTVDSIVAFSDWLPIVSLIVVASIVIYLIIKAFPTMGNAQ